MNEMSDEQLAAKLAADVEDERFARERLTAALNVALAWLDNPALGTARERDEELGGCRLALEIWGKGK